MIKEISKENEAIKFGTRLSVLYIILGVIGFVLIMLPMIFYSSDKLDNIGIVGDTVLWFKSKTNKIKNYFDKRCKQNVMADSKINATI